MKIDGVSEMVRELFAMTKKSMFQIWCICVLCVGCGMDESKNSSQLSGGLKDVSGVGMYTKTSKDGSRLYVYICDAASSERIRDWQGCEQLDFSFPDQLTGLGKRGWKRYFPSILQLHLLDERERIMIREVMRFMSLEERIIGDIVSDLDDDVTQNTDIDSDRNSQTEDDYFAFDHAIEDALYDTAPSGSIYNSAGELAIAGVIALGSQEIIRKALSRSDVYQIAKNPMMLPKKMVFLTRQAWHMKVRNMLYNFAYHRPFRLLAIFSVAAGAIIYSHQQVERAKKVASIELSHNRLPVSLWPALSTLLLQSDSYVMHVPDVDRFASILELFSTISYPIYEKPPLP